MYKMRARKERKNTKARMARRPLMRGDSRKLKFYFDFVFGIFKYSVKIEELKNSATDVRFSGI